ncbi:MAG: hypothetical protein EHM41_00970 [Chloroflexi bacterium]|nr:MAG: hypothetical protein EHM41_00970 [Chloroflexota bacterium]
MLENTTGTAPAWYGEGFLAKMKCTPVVYIDWSPAEIARDCVSFEQLVAGGAWEFMHGNSAVIQVPRTGSYEKIIIPEHVQYPEKEDEFSDVEVAVVVEDDDWPTEEEEGEVPEPPSPSEYLLQSDGSVARMFPSLFDLDV